jgi:hypothetical protein
MNKQIEALKMAIEALDNACMKIEKWTKGGKWNAGKDALAKCKEALAEAEKQGPVAWMSKMGSFTAIAETKKQLPKGSEPIPLYTHPNQELLNEYWEMGYNQCLETNKKFPIPATWQSLSDEEIWENHDKTDSDNWVIDFARANEKTLKEKNYG